MTRGGDADAATKEAGPQASPRGELLADLARRQPLLAVINMVAAVLFATGVAKTASATMLAGWVGYMVLTQAARLVFWLRWRRSIVDRQPRRATGWLVATSAAAGIGWDLIGLLFIDRGSTVQQLLVPFFLAGMAAGAVATLAGYPPALCAFLAPALLPYSARLALAAEPLEHTMALTTLAYAAGLSAVAYQIHHSLRRSVELHIENARLVADLKQARHNLEQLLEQRGAELEAVLDTVPVAVWLAHDLDARRVTGNRSAAEMLRIGVRDNAKAARAGERPRHFRVLKDGAEVPASELPVQQAARGEVVRDQELRVVFDDGTFVDELISAAPVRDAAGKVTGAVGAAIDITARKRAEDRIRHLAHHDELTGLPNRILIHQRLRQALTLARHGDAQVSLLLLDLDNFKDVNDTLGHPAGDRLLRAIGERLLATIRAGDTLGRLGGDEFAVIQPGLDGTDSAAASTQRLMDALTAPFLLDRQEVHIVASAGIALSPDGMDADELIRCADLALYRAKHDGRGRFRIFEPAMDAEIRGRRRLEHELRQALEQGEFVLHYQPQLDLATERMNVVEALVRWHHPDRGLILPAEFIPRAEASGLIRPLGAWVLEEACRQARSWRDAGRALVVAVNVSPAQLRYGGLLQTIDGALQASGLEGRWLELELTESLLVEHAEDVTDRTLRGLAARGVRLAIDDFGTGYSSLAYLRRLPVQKIKIDRSFVRDIGADPEDEAVVRAIVTLGHTLGLRVVAEGVETEA